MSLPSDDLSVPGFPAPIDLDALPSHLRDNPIAHLHVRLPAAVEPNLAALATEEVVPVEDTVRELVSPARGEP
ncbi:MAG: hypothetical protein JWM10_770 [Myxococcaceae bacterium]|nr:hypothetical protein [Myxococcaceae bacterium]